MPAPAGKVLWQAQSKEEWEAKYTAWMARWWGDGGPYMMGELMRRRGRSAGGGAEERLLRWLGEADEFGMMMMVVINGAYK